MSRTYRKPSFVRNRSETQYIDRELAYHRLHPQKRVAVKKPEDQYKAEVEAARLEYRAAINAAKKGAGYINLLHRINDFKDIRLRWVSNKIYSYIEQTEEQVISEARAEYARRYRDGHWNETGRNTGFKKQAARTLRRANRDFEGMVNRGEEHDDVVYPGTYMGKKHIWNWW